MGFGRSISARFVGRSAELRVLKAAFASVQEGGPAIVFVSGEAGIGKTRTIREFLLGIEGAQTLYGSCVPLAERGLPYGPIREALRAFLRAHGPQLPAELEPIIAPELVAIVPELGEGADAPGAPPEGGFAQLRLFELLLKLLEHLAAGAPLVLVLEDLHWADESTLGALAFLIRNLESRVLVCGTYRSDELHRTHPVKTWLAEQLRHERVRSVELKRFGSTELAEQLESISGVQPAPALIEEFMARSEGNPFLTEELAGALTEAGTLNLPGTLRELLLVRLHSLPEASQALIRSAAVGNRSVQPWLLARVAEVDEDDLYPMLRDAVDRHLLVALPEGNSFAFRHALLGEAAYSEVLPGERQALHARYAHELTKAWDEGRSEAAEALPEIAYHWDVANETERALETALAAARWAESVSAFAVAQQLYERALELWRVEPTPAKHANLDRADVLAHAGAAANFAGDHQRAIALVSGALAALGEDKDVAREADWQRDLAWYHFRAGSIDAALVAMDRALHLSADYPPSPQRAGILAAAGRLHMLSGRHAEAQRLCQEAIDVARRTGARREEGVALNPLGVVLAYDGRVDEAVDAIRASLEIAQEFGDLEAAAIASINLGEVLLMSGRLRESAEVSRRGFDMSSRAGLERAYGWFLRINEEQALFELGEWEEARRILDGVRGDTAPSVTREFLICSMMRLNVAQGRLEPAEEDAQSLADVSAIAPTPEGKRHLNQALAELRLLQRRFEEARVAVIEGLDASALNAEAGRAGELAVLGLRVEAELAELARAGDARSSAAEPVAAARSLMARVRAMEPAPLDPASSPFPEVPGWAALAAAELARAEGHDDPGLWDEVVEFWRTLGRPHHVAYGLWRRAASALSNGAPRREAAGHLRESYELAAKLGAGFLLREIEALARRARIDLDEGATAEERAAPADHGLGLTERELEVLRHLAAGLTNRQIGEALFISPKTASLHVSSILRKLGVSGRVEAAGIAHRLGLVDVPGNGGTSPRPSTV